MIVARTHAGASMRRPAPGMHRPAFPRPTCSVDVRLAGEGDKLARQRLHQEKYRAGKRMRDIELFDAQSAAQR